MVTVDMLYGESKMKLSEIINQLDQFSCDDTIYAKQPWTFDSEAIVATEPDNGGIPNEATQIDAAYFLEIFLAKEFMGGWLSNLDSSPSSKEKCLRLIKYIENDA